MATKRRKPLRFQIPTFPPLPDAVEEVLRSRGAYRTITIEAYPPGQTSLNGICRTVRGATPERGEPVRMVEGLEKVLEGATAGAAFGLTWGRATRRAASGSSAT
jgi:hypothetical protein